MQDLIKYYSQDYEDRRLQMDNAHKIEYITTLYYLEKTLSKNCTVLDACAGTGAYAFPLADKGFAITAGDLVPFNIDKIKEKLRIKPVIKDIHVCNVLNMPQFENEQFDAVLCLGALYHLFSVEEQRKAVLECLRVLKPGGIFAAAYISRYAQVIIGLAREGAESLDACLDVFDKGQTNLRPEGNLFYRTTPDKIEKLMLLCNLQKMYNVGTDGIGYAIPHVINSMDDITFNKWAVHHLRTCEEPSILGYSLHGLYIGRKQPC